MGLDLRLLPDTFVLFCLWNPWKAFFMRLMMPLTSHLHHYGTIWASLRGILLLLRLSEVELIRGNERIWKLWLKNWEEEKLWNELCNLYKNPAAKSSTWDGSLCCRDYRRECHTETLNKSNLNWIFLGTKDLNGFGLSWDYADFFNKALTLEDKDFIVRIEE